MKFKPAGSNVLIKADEVGNETEGGLILPDNQIKRASQGTVFATGPGYLTESGHIPIHVDGGDKVVYAPYAGTAITIEGDEFLIMKENDILGILE